MRDLSLEKLKQVIEEEARSTVILPFDYEYPINKVVELVPVAIEAVRKHHQDYDIAIGAYIDVVIVHPIKASKLAKTQLTLHRNIHNVSFYVRDATGIWVSVHSHPWALRLLKEAGIVTATVAFEMETKDSWGGYGHECGGSHYVFRILKNGAVVAEGQASYNACIPGHEGANYAYTEVRLAGSEPVLVSAIDGVILLQP